MGGRAKASKSLCTSGQSKVIANLFVAISKKIIFYLDFRFWSGGTSARDDDMIEVPGSDSRQRVIEFAGKILFYLKKIREIATNLFRQV